MKYLYYKKSLLDNPERYEYSNYYGKEFIIHFFNFRNSILHEIKEKINIDYKDLKDSEIELHIKKEYSYFFDSKNNFESVIDTKKELVSIFHEITNKALYSANKKSLDIFGLFKIKFGLPSQVK